jgi:polyhydroxyalkanoate synthesis repressor PhaR
MIKNMAANRIVVKKYENRRLYDTANSRYVNLEDIAQLVRDGNEVQVVDAASGEDLTRIVLTQIVVEHAKAPETGFPLDLLRQMVVASGNAGKDSLISYMRSMVEVYQNAYRAFTPALPLNIFEAPAGKQAAPQAAPSAPATPAPSAADESAVAELQRRIEELERLVVASRSESPHTPKAKKMSAGKRVTRR